MRQFTWRICSFAVIVCGLGGGLPAAEMVDPAKVEALARPLIEGGWVQGLAVGLIGPQGTKFAGLGHVVDEKSAPPNAETMFEIGSISKVFTGLLLAEMVEDHTVRLDQPVQELLGKSMTVPTRGERQITLVDLVTHTAALPFMPGNLKPKDPANPIADYTVEQMAQFISDYKLKRDIGTRSEYSNLGVGLLGHALAMRAGTSYEALLRKRIGEPLGLASTVITLDSAQVARMAQGHDADGDPAPNWDLPTLAGAGAIRSSVNDLLKFLAANLALERTPLATAIATSHEVQFRDPKRADDLAFAWQVRRDEHLIWHNGQTGAFHAFAGFNTEKRIGVVILANTASRRVDELGFRLVKLLTTGEAEPLTLASAIHLESDAIQPFVGTYQLGPLVMAAITREGDQLSIQLTGQQKFKIHPVSNTRFVCRVVDAAVIFESNPEGEVTRLVLDQNGLKLPAPRKK